MFQIHILARVQVEDAVLVHEDPEPRHGPDDDKDETAEVQETIQIDPVFDVLGHLESTLAEVSPAGLVQAEYRLSTG